MRDPNGYVQVSREQVNYGILPWAGPRYRDEVRKLVREDAYDDLVYLIPEPLLEVYRNHPPANERMTNEEARQLGLVRGAADDSNSFMHRLRRALGNPDS
jgi:hypothetical protein